MPWASIRICVCLYLGIHEQYVKDANYRNIKVKISSLIEDKIEKTPQAIKSVVVSEASKTLIANYFLAFKNNLSMTLTF